VKKFAVSLIIFGGILNFTCTHVAAEETRDERLNRIRNLFSSLKEVEKKEPAQDQRIRAPYLPEQVEGPVEEAQESIEPEFSSFSGNRLRYKGPFLPDDYSSQKEPVNPDRDLSKMPEYLRLENQKPDRKAKLETVSMVGSSASLREEAPLPSRVEVEDTFEQRPKAVRVEETEVEQSGRELTYHVQPGDSLQLIARKLYKNPEKYKDLMLWNSMSDTVLQAGQKLKLEEAPTQNEEILSAQRKRFEDLFSSHQYKYKIHKVRSGDSLARIAKKYLGSQNAYLDVARLNEIDPSKFLIVGQKLIVPVSKVMN